MLSDDLIAVSFLLMNCVLDDMRPCREDKLNRLIERKLADPSLDTETDSQKSMLDVTYQQTKTDIFGNPSKIFNNH